MSERDRVEALMTLGLPRRSNRAEIRAAYLCLARQLHPDRNAASASEFQRIASAYELLRRHHRRPAHGATGPTREGEHFDESWWRAFGEKV